MNDSLYSTFGHDIQQLTSEDLWDIQMNERYSLFESLLQIDVQRIEAASRLATVQPIQKEIVMLLCDHPCKGKESHERAVQLDLKCAP
jgi:hypothetical protein